MRIWDGTGWENQLDGARGGKKTKIKVKKRQWGWAARPQEDIVSKGPSAIGACRHSKLPLSDMEMLSVLAEGKRSLWSVGLW